MAVTVPNRLQIHPSPGALASVGGSPDQWRMSAFGNACWSLATQASITLVSTSSEVRRLYWNQRRRGGVELVCKLELLMARLSASPT